MTTPPVVSITDELIAELEAAANAATPGPWEHLRINDISWVASEEWEILDLRCDKPLDAEDGEYIAQANPATILALLAERADLKLQLAAAAITADNCELFRKDAERMRYALERLAQVPGCGCSFPCRCGGAEWTRAELEGRMDLAADALARSAAD